MDIDLKRYYTNYGLKKILETITCYDNKTNIQYIS